jgi:hypothetical protein
MPSNEWRKQVEPNLRSGPRVWSREQIGVRSYS